MVRWLVIGTCVVLLLVAGWWIGLQNSSEVLSEDVSPTTDVNTVPSIEPADREQAAKVFQQLFAGREPTDFDLLSIATELAIKDSRFETALRYSRLIPTDHPNYGPISLLQAGTVLISLNRAAEAEQTLRDYLNTCRERNLFVLQDVVLAYKWLNYLLSVELRLEDRKQTLQEMHQLGIADLQDSKQFFFPNLLILNSPAGRDRTEKFHEVDPGNRLISIAKARYQTLAGDYPLAINSLQALLEQDAKDQDVIASLLEAYFEAGMDAEFAALADSMAEYTDGEPWLVTQFRGERALQREQFSDAVRFFEIVLMLDPANPISQMGLATSLGRNGDKAKQSEALQRSGVLAKIRVNLNKIQGDKMAAMRELIQHCEELKFDVATQTFQLHAKAMEANAVSNNE